MGPSDWRKRHQSFTTFSRGRVRTASLTARKQSLWTPVEITAAGGDELFTTRLFNIHLMAGRTEYVRSISRIAVGSQFDRSVGLVPAGIFLTTRVSFCSLSLFSNLRVWGP